MSDIENTCSPEPGDPPRLTWEELEQIERFIHLGIPSQDAVLSLVKEVKNWRSTPTVPHAEYARGNLIARLENQEKLRKVAEQKLDEVTDQLNRLVADLKSERDQWSDRIAKLQKMINLWPK